MRRAIIGKSKVVDDPTPLLGSPTIHSKNIAFSNITSSGMKLTWTNGDGNARIVFISLSPYVDFFEVVSRLHTPKFSLYSSAYSSIGGNYANAIGDFPDNSGDTAKICGIVSGISRTLTFINLPSLTTFYFFVLEVNIDTNGVMALCNGVAPSLNPRSKATL